MRRQQHSFKPKLPNEAVNDNSNPYLSGPSSHALTADMKAFENPILNQPHSKAYRYWAAAYDNPKTLLQTDLDKDAGSVPHRTLSEPFESLTARKTAAKSMNHSGDTMMTAFGMAEAEKCV